MGERLFVTDVGQLHDPAFDSNAYYAQCADDQLTARRQAEQEYIDMIDEQWADEKQREKEHWESMEREHWRVAEEEHYKSMAEDEGRADLRDIIKTGKDPYQVIMARRNGGMARVYFLAWCRGMYLERNGIKC